MNEWADVFCYWKWRIFQPVVMLVLRFSFLCPTWEDHGIPRPNLNDVPVQSQWFLRFQPLRYPNIGLVTCGPNQGTPDQVGVSKNRGTPKSSILIGFSIITHPFWGFSCYFWKHPSKLNRIELWSILRFKFRGPWNFVGPTNGQISWIFGLLFCCRTSIVKSLNLIEHNQSMEPKRSRVNWCTNGFYTSPGFSWNTFGEDVRKASILMEMGGFFPDGSVVYIPEQTWHNLQTKWNNTRLHPLNIHEISNFVYHHGKSFFDHISSNQKPRSVLVWKKNMFFSHKSLRCHLPHGVSRPSFSRWTASWFFSRSETRLMSVNVGWKALLMNY